MKSRSRRSGLEPPEASSGCLNVVDSHFAAATVLRRIKGNLLTFSKAANSSALKGGRMNEHVLAAVFRVNEAEALRAVVELHSARNHSIVLRSCQQRVRRSARCATSPGSSSFERAERRPAMPSETARLSSQKSIKEI